MAKCSNPLDEVQIGGGQCWSVGAKVLEAEGLILFADRVVLAAGMLTEAMQEEGGCQRQTAKEPGKGWCVVFEANAKDFPQQSLGQGVLGLPRVQAMLNILVVHVEDHVSEPVAGEVGEEGTKAVEHGEGFKELNVLLVVPVWNTVSEHQVQVLRSAKVASKASWACISPDVCCMQWGWKDQGEASPAAEELVPPSQFSYGQLGQSQQAEG
ncbi:hypothetical protein NDA11_007662 [Ustilago hordei]|nr:hypothetical protein NDA11_007662 [Ustilago hordei]KAJ1601386.1 hypothetical protein NDA14_002022 [Ustilago hordei]